MLFIFSFYKSKIVINMDLGVRYGEFLLISITAIPINLPWMHHPNLSFVIHLTPSPLPRERG
jgi:hypothetical protein